MKSRTISKMGLVESKTRSLGQILEKPCVRSRGHIFSPLIMKLGQNVCLGEISDQFRKWVMSDQKLHLVQILEKTCVRSRGHPFIPIIMKLDQNICIDKISDQFENGSCQKKTR